MSFPRLSVRLVVLSLFGIAAALSVLSTQSKAGNPAYSTIQGIVAVRSVYTHVVIKLSSGRQVTVYTSQLKSANVGDTVLAMGYFNSKGNFQAASAHVVKTSTRPSPEPSARPSPRPSAKPSAQPSAAPPCGSIFTTRTARYLGGSNQAEPSL